MIEGLYAVNPLGLAEFLLIVSFVYLVAWRSGRRFGRSEIWSRMSDRAVVRRRLATLREGRRNAPLP